MHEGGKVFSILSFTRLDLAGKGLSEEQLASLTDDDLEKIASDLRKAYTQAMSLDEAIEFQVKLHLVFKK